MYKPTAMALALLLSSSLGANSYLTNASVQSQVDAQGLGADACQRAGVTVLRHNYPNQVAIQVGGNDPNDPNRIFTRPGTGSYFLTDVGSQWSSAVAQNQTLMAIVETIPGLHGWTGAAYAGAGKATVTKPDVVAGRLALSSVLMTRLPSPQLLQASLSSIYLNIPGSADPSGQGTGLRLWRKKADLPSDPWLKIVDLPWVSGAQDLTDAAVTADESYNYAISFIYDWPGGLGAGADPSQAGSFVTVAKGLSARIVANPIQPTPTPFPTLVVANPTPNLGQDPWIAYPNPLVGSDLHLAFKTELAGAQYWLSVHALDGEKVMGYHGVAESAGWQAPLINLKKLASGIYLVRLSILETGKDEKILPVRKLAIIK